MKARSPGQRTGLSLPVFLALSLVILPLPATAHAMAGGVDYVNGIDDLWPIHASLMTAGIASILIAMGIVRFGKKRTRWWYKVHPVFALAGAALAIAAIGVAFIMVANSHQPHLQYFHGWLGALTIAVVIATPLIMTFRMQIAMRLGRPPALIHRVAGFTAFGLMAANILLGLSMMHVI